MELRAEEVAAPERRAERAAVVGRGDGCGAGFGGEGVNVIYIGLPGRFVEQRRAERGDRVPAHVGDFEPRAVGRRGRKPQDLRREDAKEYVEELRRKVMELTLPHRFSKMLPIVTITQGMYCDVPKEENRVWDFLHVADEILYSVKTDNRGSCRVVDRAEFKLMSGYGTTIQGQA